MLNLLANKLLLACSVGLVGVSVIALPTTLILTSGKSMSEIVQPLNSAIEKAQEQGKSQFENFPQQLQTKYESFGNDVADHATVAPSNVSTQLQNISNGAQVVAQLANEKKEMANYYAFQLGHLIKALIKHIPSITKESIVESVLGDQDKHLLSFQKIYNIASNEKFGEFLMAMTDVVSKHETLLANLSNEDNSGIIRIFQELRNDNQEIQNFLSKVKENASKLDEANNYKCATKLMMHVLIGKESLEKISTTVEQLTNQLNTMQEQLNNVLKDTKVDVSGLITQLNQIKERHQQLKDPCPNEN